MAGFFLLTLFVPGIAALYLQTTRVRWLPSVALLGVAVYLFATLDNRDHGDDGISGAGLDNVLQIGYGIVMLIYATALLGFAYRPRKPPPTG